MRMNIFNNTPASAVTKRVERKQEAWRSLRTNTSARFLSLTANSFNESDLPM